MRLLRHSVRLMLLLLVISIVPVSLIQRHEHTRRGLFQVLEGRVLVKHVIATHHVTSPFDCAALCTTNTQCLSYNIKRDCICELNNATKKTNPESLQNDPLSSHYHDNEPENSKSCFDYLRNGATENGIYTITDNSGTLFNVWCDFTSELGSAWTLVLSFALKHRRKDVFCRRSFSINSPRQEDTPNWEDYRLSLARMQQLASQSTHWRATTGFPIYGVDYRDYLRCKFSIFNIMNFKGGGICKDVELINIRGYTATMIQAPFWQTDGTWSLHTDSSSKRCKFQSASSGAVGSENNFGFYCESDSSMNINFRGTTNEESTTQYWFGRYLHLVHI